MAKKNKRTKTKAAAGPAITPATVEASDNDGIEATPAEPRAPRAAKVTRSQAAAERLEDEYAYITGDLRRVFILAAAMFALLIVLNIILGRAG